MSDEPKVCEHNIKGYCPACAYYANEIAKTKSMKAVRKHHKRKRR